MLEVLRSRRGRKRATETAAAVEPAVPICDDNASAGIGAVPLAVPGGDASAGMGAVPVVDVTASAAPLVPVGDAITDVAVAVPGLDASADVAAIGPARKGGARSYYVSWVDGKRHRTVQKDVTMSRGECLARAREKKAETSYREIKVYRYK